ncbi:MAG: Wadjet anti-phage system protein JetA family protein [Verrucomicrobiota bacterium]
MGSLALDLFREVRPGLFRVLAGRNAATYVDVLDALEIESSQRHEGMTRDEALAIVGDNLAQHPEFNPDEPEIQDEASGEFISLPPPERARRVLDYLARKDVGWIEDIQLPDWRRRIRFDAHGATLLEALRRISRPDAAVFTDPFVGVCATLANVDAFAKEPFTHLENCLKGAGDGLRELRGMGKSIERFIRRQLEARTLGESYAVVFDQYAEQVGHECYAGLVRAQLPARLDAARERIRQILGDTNLLQKMQAEVMRRDGSEAAPAMARVRNHLQELEDKLDFVQPLADEIDHRTAEFTRRSLARSRYLQEIVGERRGQIKAFFEKINQSFPGRRLVDLEELVTVPPLLLPNAKLLAGRDSLYEPPRRRTLEENAPIDDTVSDAMRDEAKAQLGGAMRNSLTVARANRFIAQLPGGKGARIASQDLPIRNEDDMDDVLALLLHAESGESRYRIEVPSIRDDLPPPERDHKLTYRFDRFFVIKK